MTKHTISLDSDFELLDEDNDFELLGNNDDFELIDDESSEYQRRQEEMDQSSTLKKTGHVAKRVWQSVTKGIGDIGKGLAATAEHSKDAPVRFGLGDIDDEHYELAAKQEKQDTSKLKEDLLEKAKAPVTDDLAKALKEFSQVYPSEVDPVKGFSKGVTGFAEDVAIGLSGFAPSMVTTYLNPPAGFAAMYYQIKGDKYEELVKKGIDKSVADDASSFSALMQAPLEMAGTLVQFNALWKVAKAAAKSGMGKKVIDIVKAVAQGALGEGLEEYSQGHAEVIADIYAEFPNASQSEIAKKVLEVWKDPEFQKEQAYSFAVGAAGGAVFSGAGVASSVKFDVKNFFQNKEIKKIQDQLVNETTEGGISIPDIDADLIGTEKEVESSAISDSILEETKQEPESEQKQVGETPRQLEDTTPGQVSSGMPGIVLDQIKTEQKQDEAQMKDAHDRIAAERTRIEQEQKRLAEETSRQQQEQVEAQQEAQKQEQEQETQRFQEAVKTSEGLLEEASNVLTQLEQASEHRAVSKPLRALHKGIVTQASPEKLSSLKYDLMEARQAAFEASPQIAELAQRMINLADQQITQRNFAKMKEKEASAAPERDVGETSPETHTQGTPAKRKLSKDQLRAEIDRARAKAKKERAEYLAEREAEREAEPVTVESKPAQVIPSEPKKTSEEILEWDTTRELDTTETEPAPPLKEGRQLKYVEPNESVKEDPVPDPDIIEPLIDRIIANDPEVIPVLEKIAETYGERVFQDWASPGKLFSLAVKDLKSKGMVHAEAVDSLQPTFQRYQPVYENVRKRIPSKETEVVEEVPVKKETPKEKEIKSKLRKKVKPEPKVDTVQYHPPIKKGEGVVTKRDINAELQHARMVLGNRVKFRVLDSSNVLKGLNDSLYHAMLKEDMLNNTPAVYDGNKTIYFFADQISEKTDIGEIIWHELGHFSLQDILGKQLDPTLDQVAKKYNQEIDFMIVDQKLEDTEANQRRAANEVLVHKYLSGADRTFREKLLDLLTKFMRSMGFNTKITHKEVHDLLQAMRINLFIGKESVPKNLIGEVQKGHIQYLQKKYPKTWAQELVAEVEQIRQDMATGKLDQASPEYIKLVEKYGNAIQGYTIRHLPGTRFRIGKKKLYGSIENATKKVKTTKDPFGQLEVTEYFDKHGNLIVPGPILSTNAEQRKKEIDKLIKENMQEAQWYQEWHDWMMGFVKQGIPKDTILKYIKIQGILSAKIGPMGNQKMFTDVINMLESGTLRPGPGISKEVTGVNEPTYKKIKEIWEGRDNYTTLEERQEAYGDKVGAYITNGLIPAHDQAVTIDRHMPHLWGYNMAWNTKQHLGTDTFPATKPSKPGSEARIIKESIIAEIREAAKRNNMTPAAVQATLWFASRMPDVQPSNYIAAGQLGARYLSKDMLEATKVQEGFNAIHYSEETRKTIRGSKLSEAHEMYSNKSIGEMKRSHTKKWPYIPLGQFYSSGAKVERVVKATKKIPHLINVKPGELYDGTTDPLQIAKKTNKIMEATTRPGVKEQTPHPTNVMSKLIQDLGYKGYTYRVSNGDIWVAFFGETSVASPVQTQVRLSDVVESSFDVPQNLQALSKIAKVRTPHLVQDITNQLAERYPEVSVLKADPTVARFGDATSGMMEYGLDLHLSGPLESIRAAMSDIIGTGKSQNMVILQGTQEAMGGQKSNGINIVFKIKDGISLDQIENGLKKHGITDYNLKETASGLEVDQFFYGESKVPTNFTEFFKEFGKDGTTQFYESTSEVLDKDNYQSHVENHFGKKKGENIYAEATKRGQIHSVTGGKIGNAGPVTGERLRSQEDRAAPRDKGKDLPSTQEVIEEKSPAEILAEFRAKNKTQPQYFRRSAKVKYSTSKQYARDIEASLASPKETFGEIAARRKQHKLEQELIDKFHRENPPPASEPGFFELSFKEQNQKMQEWKDKSERIFFEKNADKVQYHPSIKPRSATLSMQLSETGAPAKKVAQLNTFMSKVQSKFPGLLDRIKSLTYAKLDKMHGETMGRSIRLDTLDETTLGHEIGHILIGGENFARGGMQEVPAIEYAADAVAHLLLQESGLKSPFNPTSDQLEQAKLLLGNYANTESASQYSVKSKPYYVSAAGFKTTLVRATSEEAARQKFNRQMGQSADFNEMVIWEQTPEDLAKWALRGEIAESYDKLDSMTDIISPERTKHQYFTKGNYESARSVIGPKGKQNPVNLLKLTLWDKFQQYAVSELTAIRKLEGGDIPAAISAHKSFKFLRSFPVIFDQFMYYGNPKYVNNHIAFTPDGLGGISQIVERLGEDTSYFFDRMLAESAQELVEKDRNYLFGMDESGNMIEDADMIQTLLDGTQERYEANKEQWDWAKARLRDINKHVLDFAEASGTIDPENRSQWERTNYIPFLRVAEKFETQTIEALYPWLGKDTQIINKLKGGSEKNLGDPLANLVHQYSFILHDALRNVAFKKSLRLAKEAGLLESIKDFPKRKPGPREVNIRVNGKKHVYRVADPWLYDSIVAIDNQHPTGALWTALSAPKRLLTWGVTVTGGFRLANAFRDHWHTYLIGSNFTPVIDTVKGMYHAWTMSPEYREYLATGGGFRGSFATREIRAKTEESVQKLKKKLHKEDAAWYKKAWDFWEQTGEVFENADRMGLYLHLKRKGMSSADAAFEARDLMDFHEMGSSTVIQFLGASVPFLNARIQGLAKMGRNMVDERYRKQLWLRGAVIAAAAFAWGLTHPDDDEPEHVERVYFTVKIPGSDKKIRLPIPFEAGSLFVVLPKLLGQRMGGKRDTKEVLGMLGRVLVDTFEFNPIPQIIKPLVEQFSNYDFFTGQPILRPHQQKLEGGLQSNMRTKRIFQELGKKLNWSPIRLEKLTRDYLGSIADVMADFLDIGINYFLPADPAGTNIDRILRATGPGRFVDRRDVPTYTRTMERFYDMVEEFDRAATSYRELRKLGDKDAAKSYRDENKTKIVMSKVMAKQQKRIQTINAKIKLVHYSQKMTAQEKRYEIDKLLRKRNEVFSRAVSKAKERLKRME